MTLVLAEKPDLGKAIAKALPGTETYNKENQTIEKEFNGETTVVAWCYGHLLTLCEPQDYDSKYAEWHLEDLPLFFDECRHKIKTVTMKGKDPKGIEKRVEQISALLEEADTVIHAGDIDDEGQLLIDELLEYCHYRGKVLRLNTSDTSVNGMKKALARMEPNEKFLANGRAAFGRQLSDQTFGFNLTRYFTIVNGSKLPVGRVKMPTLGLVVRRDMEIENHVKSYYYTLTAMMSINGKTIPCLFTPDKDNTHLQDGHILDKSYIEDIARKLKGMTFDDVSVSISEANEAPPLPFNLAKLYAYCANKWDMQPTTVRNITQILREKYSAITYNRTNCQYLFEETHKEAPVTLPIVAKRLGLEPSMFDTTIKSRCFNDNNVTEHTAIIPTGEQKFEISALTDNERKVYEAIAKYYLAQFLPPAHKKITRLEVDTGLGGRLVATSTVILSQGYRALLGAVDLSDDEAVENENVKDGKSALSDFTAGSYHGSVSKCETSQKETRPPARYTQASLCADMCCIAKYVENEQVKQFLLMKDTGKKDEHGSIGTPATRDLIIGQLISECGYLKEEKKGKKTYIVSTPLGREFYNMLPDSVRKVDVSAKWWGEQEQIRRGELTPVQMAHDVLQTVKKIIDTGVGAMDNAGQYAKGFINETVIGTCPKCGARVFETAKGYKCESCTFMLWKDNALFTALGRGQITAPMAEYILREGKIGLKNCKSKKNPDKVFNATLICDFDGEKINFRFAEGNEVINVGKCPFCGSPVVDRVSLYACNNKDCKFIVWKKPALIGGKALSDKNVSELLTKGSTRVSGCKSKKNPDKTFTCILSAHFPEPGKCEFSMTFDNSQKKK